MTKEKKEKTIQLALEEKWYWAKDPAKHPDGRVRRFMVKQVTGSTEWPTYRELELEEVDDIIKSRPEVKVTIARQK